MKIIGGIYKGTNLYVPADTDIRPALARVKNSLFNILVGRLEGKTVLDLFAGTGSLGFESLSRGAKHCLFIDNNPACIDAIKKSIAKLKLENQTKVMLMDSFNIVAYACQNDHSTGQALKTGEKFDCIFVAPPYKYYDEMPQREKLFGVINEIAEKNIITKSGIIIVEHRRKEELNNLPQMERVGLRNYGQTSLSFLKPKV